MKIRIDIKSLVAGLVLGAVVFLAMGQSFSADKSDFGIAIGYRGNALVRDINGLLYIVDFTTASAQLVEYKNGPYRGNAFNLNRSINLEQRRP